MALTPGTRFGSYEVAGEIGAGGMGVVYRARDTKLDREVAIKALPESMAADAERLSRFDREAKTLASLNHSNIAQIYGLEESDGKTALILELVEGPTLADRIARGALSADEALGIAMQIAEALEAAHGQGIVHRDLKPANVKLRPDGTVKVLDFGIAKALEPDNLVSGPQSPMLTTPATQVGVILGTAAYMSPEQAKGKPVDQRADIWAFGCLLYEMLTGQLAFGAEDVPTTLARVIANETNLDSLPSAISPAVRQTIGLCLQKDVRKRVADIRDVRLALEGAFETQGQPAAQPGAAAARLWTRPLPVAAAALVAGAVVAGLALRAGLQSEPPGVTRFAYAIPPGQTMTGYGSERIAVSPDGRHFVYNTTDGLYLRTMDELEARLIPGTMEARWNPFFSPDGQSVGYFTADGRLMRIAISGGASVLVATSPGFPNRADWSADNTIVFASSSEIYRVPATGGTPELIVPSGIGAVLYSPQLLPDGDSLLFSTGGQADGTNVVVESVATGERTVLVEGGGDARYVPTGHLIYALGNNLFAVRFDAASLRVSGGPVPLVQGVLSATQSFGSNYGISDDGTLVYVSGSIEAVGRALVWVDREGQEQPIATPPRAYISPRLSPDGTKVALNARDQENDIWLWDLTRETLTRLTFDPGLDRFPVWSPDGQQVAYSSQQGGVASVYWRAADGSGPEEQLVVSSDSQIFPTSFLPDASGFVVYGAPSAGANDDDIGFFTLGEDAATPLLATTFAERMPELSPDGRWLAYVSDESGREEIYVRPFPDIGAGGRWQVSTGGGTQPLWSRDGSELFYRNDDALLGVPVETQPSFTAGNPAVVLDGWYTTNQGGRGYDVSLDGERFLMLRQYEDAASTVEIVVVENWFAELERLAPAVE